jgi:hypothetical protein
VAVCGVVVACVYVYACRMCGFILYYLFLCGGPDTREAPRPVIIKQRKRNLQGGRAPQGARESDPRNTADRRAPEPQSVTPSKPKRLRCRPRTATATAERARTPARPTGSTLEQEQKKNSAETKKQLPPPRRTRRTTEHGRERREQAKFAGDLLCAFRHSIRRLPLCMMREPPAHPSSCVGKDVGAFERSLQPPRLPLNHRPVQRAVPTRATVRK